jgi:hypothetical protein
MSFNCPGNNGEDAGPTTAVEGGLTPGPSDGAPMTFEYEPD